MLSASVGAGVFVLLYFLSAKPTEQSLRMENQRLRSQYAAMKQRLDASAEVMNRLERRDDNFYRALLQLEPVSPGLRKGSACVANIAGDVQAIDDATLLSALSQQLNVLERRLYTQIKSYDQLQHHIASHRAVISQTPSILPIPFGRFIFAAGYGFVSDPATGTRIDHKGIDLACETGTPVTATGDGVIEFVGRRGSEGICIQIAHGSQYTSMYSHLSAANVKEGEAVEKGDVIGYVGNTGRSFGSHLHYEVKLKGEPQDPLNYCVSSLTPEEYESLLKSAEDAGCVME